MTGMKLASQRTRREIIDALKQEVTATQKADETYQRWRTITTDRVADGQAGCLVQRVLRTSELAGYSCLCDKLTAKEWLDITTHADDCRNKEKRQRNYRLKELRLYLDNLPTRKPR